MTAGQPTGVVDPLSKEGISSLILVASSRAPQAVFQPPVIRREYPPVDCEHSLVLPKTRYLGALAAKSSTCWVKGLANRMIMATTKT